MAVCVLAPCGRGDDRWWSLEPVVRPAVPRVEESDAAVRNPIDSFIDAKLDEHGLQRTGRADPRTLCRRLFFDLSGLPPTFEEVEDFARSAAADAEAAIESLVNRLLASPRYGERWARHWLDVVHYGETHGYDKDQPRPNAWPYRDYVIRAFNEDRPYARFVQEQLAGDVLFPDTRDGIEALGFIAAGPWDLIGHAELPEEKIDGKIARHLDRDDMVANTLNTFCSLTAHCAQCHDHKFDPVRCEDYYSLQSVFSALDRADRRYHSDPALNRRLTSLENRGRELDARRSELDEKIRAAGGPELADIDKRIVDSQKSSKPGSRPEFGYHSAIELSDGVRKWAQVDLGSRRPISHVVVAPCHDDFNGIGAGFGFPVRFRIEAGDDAEFAVACRVIGAHDHADFANPGTMPQKFDSAGMIARYVRVTATKLAPRAGDFIFALAELEVIDVTGKNLAAGATVTVLDSIEAPPRWRRENLVDGVYPAAGGPVESDLADLKRRRAALVDRVAPELARELTEVDAARGAVESELKQLPSAQVVYAGTVHHGSGNFRGTGGTGGRPRPIFLLSRGDVKRPGPEATPGAPEAISPAFAQFGLAADTPDGERRIALARWITDPSHPLTWRSIVNRVWQYHFGRGLVDTPNDFGRMGARPSHPELLDWLAAWFRDDAHGSLKRLHRLIVTSETYLQASGARTNDQAGSSRPGRPRHGAPPPDAELVDSENRLLWRMNRRKLEAEPMRDAVLDVSGRLDLRMGGPSFQDFVITHPEHSPHYEYHLADPDNPSLHRRAIYRFVVRSQQQPWMAAMDCADPSMLVDKRIQTITAIQALAQLNNQLIIAMAKHFAARLEREAGPGVTAQITRAFRLALARNPSPQELEALAPYTARHGLENTCRLIFNLNEFAFVD